MKKIIIALLVFVCFQKANSQDLLDILAKEVCECSKSKQDKLKNPETLQMELGLCIMTSFSNHESQVKEKYGDILSEKGDMQKLGEDIGWKMAAVCPDVVMAMASTGFLEEDAEQENSILEGQFIQIKIEQFTSLLLKDSTGRTHTFLLLNFCEGSNLITENLLKKNDKIAIEYFENEFFDPKAKDFRNYKIIQGLKKI